jgi:hypothetical protein
LNRREKVKRAECTHIKENEKDRERTNRQRQQVKPNMNRAEEYCSREELQNSEKVVRIDLSVLLVIQSFICNKGGREVLGRIVVLIGSSGCLNTGSCIFHLVVAKKTRVAGWCKGEQLFSVMQVGACVTGSWCFHPVGSGRLRELLLPSSGC